MVRLKMSAKATNKNPLWFIDKPLEQREEEEIVPQTETMAEQEDEIMSDPERRAEQDDERMSRAERRQEESDEATEAKRRPEDSDDGTDVLQPLRMYFSPTHYRASTRVATFCYIYKAMNTINEILDADEKRWFHEHPQFRHFFHMPLEEQHRMQGMYMLVLRAACTEKKKECWFVVNGVPVRYSLREHALISGMYCHPYPDSFDRLGSLDFVK
ncbi:unnamed protein product [Microthlaspi erraticum]|uniref:DUF1985 domain-containing protein n=1 Tax=Microthlaspi erraticum TaxID=1685480 RepID=A0A6D2IPW8_9BRAS|nr:unnamed protein product [Microthlaspi erraticum]